MAFPTSPSDGQEYTTALGTVYKYVEADDKWILVSSTLAGVTGVQGETGLAGPAGATGVAGAAGAAGETGASGAAGATGLAGAAGATGLAGAAGAAGETGASGVGATGLQGVTGIDLAVYDAGTFGSTGATINFSNGYNQKVTLGAGGETGLLYVTGSTGQKGIVKFSYDRNSVPRGSTGIKWANGLFPTLSGQTGIEDLVTVYTDGTGYYGQAALGYKYV